MVVDNLDLKACGGVQRGAGLESAENDLHASVHLRIRAVEGHKDGVAVVIGRDGFHLSGGLLAVHGGRKHTLGEGDFHKAGEVGIVAIAIENLEVLGAVQAAGHEAHDLVDDVRHLAEHTSADGDVVADTVGLGGSFLHLKRTFRQLAVLADCECGAVNLVNLTEVDGSGLDLRAVNNTHEVADVEFSQSHLGGDDIGLQRRIGRAGVVGSHADNALADRNLESVGHLGVTVGESLERVAFNSLGDSVLKDILALLVKFLLGFLQLGVQ